MVRVKRGTTAHKRRKKVLKQTKGFKWGRKSKYKSAKDALAHAQKYAYRDRKTKKRNMRNLWQIRINSLCRKHGLPYNRFINGLKNKKIEIDRKILSELTEKNPKIFEKIVEKAKK